jgi:rhamnosyltransferase
VREARGEIVALTVQDATPAARDWLATMTSHFDDPEVVGVFCNQIPRKDCDPFLKHRLSGWVRGGGEPSRRRVTSVEEFWSLPPTERWMRAQFDNVASAVRRSFALEHPFPKRRFGEDVTWAKQAILALKTIVMEPRTAVVHSHKNSIWYEFKRAYLDHQNINDLFGVRLAPRLRDAIGATGPATRELWRVVRSDASLGTIERLRWILAAPYFAFTQNLGQYLGPLSNACGRRGLISFWDRYASRGV